jgi:hypothetical protein
MESQDKNPVPKKRTRTRKVTPPPTEKVELTVEEPVERTEKYKPKPKIGRNRPKNTVHTVGLGNLKVETVKGFIDG